MDKIDNFPISGNIKRLIREDESDKKKPQKKWAYLGKSLMIC